MSQHTPQQASPPTTARGVVHRLYWVKRWLYRGGRPRGLAKGLNRLWASAFAAGRLSPSNAMTLQVPGRRTGKTITFPVVVADYDGGRYLVSMLGKDANWVQNVRANNGYAVLRRNGAEQVQLLEVDPAQAAPVLRAYLDAAPGARPHIPVDRRAPLADFEQIAPDFPAFRIVPAATPATSPATPAEGPERGHVDRGPEEGLELSAHLKVRPGQLDGFTTLAAECIRLTRERDTGTLRYDWYLSSDGTICEVREAYTGPRALVEHRANVGAALQVLLEKYADDHEMAVYGDATDELQQLAEAHQMTDHITWFTFLDGLKTTTDTQVPHDTHTEIAPR